MKRWVLVILFVAVGLLFIPREGLYFSLEEELNCFDIVVNNEEISQSMGELSIDHATIVYKGIKLGTLQSVSAYLFGLYNTATFTNFNPSKDLFPLFPGSISTLILHNTLWDPSLLSFEGNGDIGTFKGNINGKTKQITVNVSPTTQGEWQFRHWLKFLNKTDKGYQYETSYE